MKMKIAVLWRSLSIEEKPVVNFVQRGNVFFLRGNRDFLRGNKDFCGDVTIYHGIGISKLMYDDDEAKETN
jgi:hypothetical protein